MQPEAVELLALAAAALAFAVVVYAVAGRSAIKTQARPPLFNFPAGAALERARAAIRSATVPEQYRSILNLRELESAAAGGSPALWLVALLALAFAVTR